MEEQNSQQQQEIQLKVHHRILDKLLPSRKAGKKLQPTIVKFKNEKDSKFEPPDPGPLLPKEDLEEIYRSYPERWWLLVTVILLNLANYSHWVAFPSVTKIAAKYYDQDGNTMDLIPTLSYGLGVPCCLLATVIVDKLGLKIGLHIGGTLTGVGM